MTDDNGAGLRMLFHGLCSFWDIEAWDGEKAQEPAADFFLPYIMGSGVFAVIVPEPAARQVEIAAVRQHWQNLLVLDRDDLDNLRLAGDKTEAAEVVRNWILYDTHGSVMRRHLGITS
jgi:hypothetical protein